MQYSVSLESDHNSGNIKLKTISNPYKKSNLNNIVDQLCTRLQDIEDQEGASRTGMPTCSFEDTEAVRRYYAAFPPLNKGQESPLPYYLPPPAWCRKSVIETQIKMQSEMSVSKDWYNKNKKLSTSKERRNSYHGQRKNNRKRCNSYSKSFESKESLPEWVTHEGVWDIETQDPVKEFIRAIAIDEGYGTCENTVTDEIKVLAQGKINMDHSRVPDWDDAILDIETGWSVPERVKAPAHTPTDEELVAQFEAKFDRSLEALWSKDQATPDDEYQDLPIDFQDLLSSPSDRLFAVPSYEKYSLVSFTESIWSTDPHPHPPALDRGDSPPLHDRLRPLNIADAVEPQPRLSLLEQFALYEGDRLYDALETAARTMRSFAALNHRGDRSAFAELAPRSSPRPVPPAPPRRARSPSPPPGEAREDLLTAARTHFRPIRREPDPDRPRYADGDTFDIGDEHDAVEFRRSDSGGAYLCSSQERYLLYRGSRDIDYDLLNLTEEQRRPHFDEPAAGLRLRFPLRQRDAGVQTDEAGGGGGWSVCASCQGAKRARSIWSQCAACAPPPPARAAPPHTEELARDWEELVEDMSAQYAVGAGGDRKRRHSAALRCAPACTHPHARFLPCCAHDRPLTR